MSDSPSKWKCRTCGFLNYTIHEQCVACFKKNWFCKLNKGDSIDFFNERLQCWQIAEVDDGLWANTYLFLIQTADSNESGACVDNLNDSKQIIAPLHTHTIKHDHNNLSLKCAYCQRLRCQICYSSDESCHCENSEIAKEQMELTQNIHTTVSTQIEMGADVAKIIALYAMGAIVDCCNTTQKCHNKVIFQSKFELNHQPKDEHRKVYEVDSRFIKNSHPLGVVNIYGRWYRVCCDDCKENSKSCYGICWNRDAEFEMCFNHQLCAVCRNIFGRDVFDTEVGEDEHIEKFWCNKCMKYICDSCQMDGFCEYCHPKQELEDIKKAILSSEIIMDFEDYEMNIILEITRFTVGFLLECMNKTCSSDIIINNKFQYEKGYDHKRNIFYYYYLNEPNLWDSVYTIYGENVRIFCGECEYEYNNEYCGDNKLCTRCYKFDEDMNKKGFNECQSCRNRHR